MRRLTRPQRLLADQAVRVLAADVGRTDAELARILGADMTELRHVTGALYGMCRVDRCRDYLVLSPRPVEGRRAA
jgi:hypothetical protein